MFVQLLLLFILVPMADLVLLLVIHHYLTLVPTVMLVITTGIGGAWLARQQWGWLMARMRDRISQNQIPTELFSDGAMILMAGALLITPGVITDLIGVSLLIPACRRWYRRRLAHWVTSRFEVHTYRQFSDGEADIVEGRVHPQASPQTRQPSAIDQTED